MGYYFSMITCANNPEKLTESASAGDRNQANNMSIEERNKTSNQLDDLVMGLFKKHNSEQIVGILHGLIRHSILYPEPIEKVITTASKLIK
jgi:hypothetical protein